MEENRQEGKKMKVKRMAKKIRIEEGDKGEGKEERI